MNIRFQNVIPIPMEGFVQKSDIWLKECELQSGKSYQIVAPSGTGKSSLVHILFGIRSDFSGEVLFDSQSLRNISLSQWNVYRKEYISIVFQGLRLFHELPVWDNLRIKNKLTNYKSDAEIQVLLERLGMDTHIHKKAGVLSFGQQQRIALIRSLCQPFKFLLLDEPFSHLDEDNAKIAMQIIEEEVEKQGAGLIITSLHTNSYSQKQHVLYL